jgi:hypothetical protein
MLKVDDYRKHAEECLALARRASQPDIRESLIKMADTWNSLADERERAIKKNPPSKSSGPL